ATADAGELVYLLSREVQVVAHGHRVSATRLHLRVAFTGNHHEVLVRGVPVPGHNAARLEFQQQHRRALRWISSLRGEGHAGWEHGQGHELTRRHGGIRHLVSALRHQWSVESRCEQNKQYQVSESHRNTPPRGESRQSLAQRCGRFQSDKSGGRWSSTYRQSKGGVL